MAKWLNLSDERKREVIKIGFSVLVALGIYFFLPDSCPAGAKRMAFIVVVAGLLWGLEAIPLYATSLVVILLEVFLLARPDSPLNLGPAGYKMFLVPFGSPIIMLFFGGFILATALHKYKWDSYIAAKLMGVFGENPKLILIGFMMTTAFLSMWMSNTATTAMMLVMLKPLLKQIDSDNPFRVALVLAIPFGANIGGIGTPVGTPPNAIALGILANEGIYINFLSWMVMAVPLSVVLLALASVLLFVLYPAKVSSLRFNITSDLKLNKKSVATIWITIITIVLWLTSGWHKIPSAVTALLAAGLFFAMKILDSQSLKSIDWDVLVLMWGGLALGVGMQASGLTEWMLSLPLFQGSGWLLMISFALLAVLLSTFISNTATANLVIPIAISLPGESPILLGLVVALACSMAMAFPISTPPNAMAFSSKAISFKDMLKSGTAVSILGTALVIAGAKFVIGRIFLQ